MTAVLEARGLSVRRGPRLVVADVSLGLGPGEALALIGPNAAGKSTLVRALAGLLPPSAGEERTRLGRYPHRGPLRPFTAEDDTAVARALERSGVETLADRPLATLSAGERQLAALARGLAQEPAILLLDEPAAHLDIGHQLRLFRVLDEVRREGVGVLAVVHDLPRAAAWAERLVLLAGGRVVAEGPPAAVLAGPAAAEAFEVAIRAEHLAGRPVYLFDEKPSPRG